MANKICLSTPSKYATVPTETGILSRELFIDQEFNESDYFLSYLYLNGKYLDCNKDFNCAKSPYGNNAYMITNVRCNTFNHEQMLLNGLNVHNLNTFYSEILTNLPNYHTSKIPCNLPDYLINAVAILLDQPSLLKRLFTLESNNTHRSKQLDNGAFRLCLFINGEWLTITLDTNIPLYGDMSIKNTIMKGITDNQLHWLFMLHKAYAKINGAYEYMQNGSLINMLESLTGDAPNEIIMHSGNKNEIWGIIKTALSNGNVIIMAQDLAKKGFNVVETKKIGKGIQAVKINDPLNMLNGKNWGKMPAKVECLNKQCSSTRSIWLTMDVYLQEFNTTTIIYTSHSQWHYISTRIFPKDITKATVAPAVAAVTTTTLTTLLKLIVPNDTDIRLSMYHIASSDKSNYPMLRIILVRIVKNDELEYVNGIGNTSQSIHINQRLLAGTYIMFLEAKPNQDTSQGFNFSCCSREIVQIKAIKQANLVKYSKLYNDLLENVMLNMLLNNDFPQEKKEPYGMINTPGSCRRIGSKDGLVYFLFINKSSIPNNTIEENIRIEQDGLELCQTTQLSYQTVTTGTPVSSQSSPISSRGNTPNEFSFIIPPNTQKILLYRITKPDFNYKYTLASRIKPIPLRRNSNAEGDLIKEMKGILNEDEDIVLNKTYCDLIHNCNQPGYSFSGLNNTPLANIFQSIEKNTATGITITPTPIKSERNDNKRSTIKEHTPTERKPKNEHAYTVPDITSSNSSFLTELSSSKPTIYCTPQKKRSIHDLDSRKYILALGIARIQKAIKFRVFYKLAYQKEQPLNNLILLLKIKILTKCIGPAFDMLYVNSLNKAKNDSSKNHRQSSITAKLHSKFSGNKRNVFSRENSPDICTMLDSMTSNERLFSLKREKVNKLLKKKGNLSENIERDLVYEYALYQIFRVTQSCKLRSLFKAFSLILEKSLQIYLNHLQLDRSTNSNRSIYKTPIKSKKNDHNNTETELNRLSELKNTNKDKLKSATSNMTRSNISKKSSLQSLLTKKMSYAKIDNHYVDISSISPGQNNLCKAKYKPIKMDNKSKLVKSALITGQDNKGQNELSRRDDSVRRDDNSRQDGQGRRDEQGRQDGQIRQDGQVRQDEQSRRDENNKVDYSGYSIPMKQEASMGNDYENLNQAFDKRKYSEADYLGSFDTKSTCLNEGRFNKGFQSVPFIQETAFSTSRMQSEKSYKIPVEDNGMPRFPQAEQLMTLSAIKPLESTIPNNNALVDIDKTISMTTSNKLDSSALENAKLKTSIYKPNIPISKLINDYSSYDQDNTYYTSMNEFKESRTNLFLNNYHQTHDSYPFIDSSIKTPSFISQSYPNDWKRADTMDNWDMKPTTSIINKPMSISTPVIEARKINEALYYNHMKRISWVPIESTQSDNISTTAYGDLINGDDSYNLKQKKIHIMTSALDQLNRAIQIIRDNQGRYALRMINSFGEKKSKAEAVVSEKDIVGKLPMSSSKEICVVRMGYLLKIWKQRIQSQALREMILHSDYMKTKNEIGHDLEEYWVNKHNEVVQAILKIIKEKNHAEDKLLNIILTNHTQHKKTSHYLSESIAIPYYPPEHTGTPNWQSERMAASARQSQKMFNNTVTTIDKNSLQLPLKLSQPQQPQLSTSLGSALYALNSATNLDINNSHQQPQLSPTKMNSILFESSKKNNNDLLFSRGNLIIWLLKEIKELIN